LVVSDADEILLTHARRSERKKTKTRAMFSPNRWQLVREAISAFVVAEGDGCWLMARSEANPNPRVSARGESYRHHVDRWRSDRACTRSRM